VPGVYAVYTSDDVRKVIPDPYYGPAFHDQPILAIGKVHFVGEPVAVVLASDPHVADQAAQQIVAEYEELPAVFDEVEAAENKTLVHDELKPAGTFADQSGHSDRARVCPLSDNSGQSRILAPLMTQSGHRSAKLNEKIWRSTLCRIDTIGGQPRLLD
jgi:CO/xanthine dehydrogenase Mo-binding subunit